MQTFRLQSYCENLELAAEWLWLY